MIPVFTPVTTHHGTSVVRSITPRVNPNTPIIFGWKSIIRNIRVDEWLDIRIDKSWSFGPSIPGDGGVSENGHAKIHHLA